MTGTASDGDRRTNRTGDIPDEAARLLQAVQEWARRSVPADHLSTGSPECTWCPVCQLVAALRGERPEVTERLAEAGTAVLTAVRALLDPTMTTSKASPSPTASRVQHIDLGTEH